MTKVSVIGAAGTVGAAAGYTIALRDVADELVFVDIPDMEAETVGQAADANHGIAYDSNTVVRQGGYEATEGSDVVVITAGIPRKPGQTRIDLAGDNAPIMEDIGSSLAEYNDDFVSITTRIIIWRGVCGYLRDRHCIINHRFQQTIIVAVTRSPQIGIVGF